MEVDEDLQQAGPHLVIREQPKSDFRFRYKTEVKAAHGCLQGISSTQAEKTFPTVELRSHNQPAFLICTLYQIDQIQRKHHAHKLIIRKNKKFCDGPHIVAVCPLQGYNAIFKGMSIMHTPRKHIKEEIFNKKTEELRFELGRDLSPEEKRCIRDTVDIDAQGIDLNRACLCFRALGKNSDGVLVPICKPVFSNIISNLKSSITGELRITRLSSASSNVKGNESLILLVERVGKTNISVRFYEENTNGDLIWEDWGRFHAKDVHHQYAITLKTPPYYDKNINDNVIVNVQLVRKSDKAMSDPVKFMYIPYSRYREEKVMDFEI